MDEGGILAQQLAILAVRVAFFGCATGGGGHGASLPRIEDEGHDGVREAARVIGPDQQAVLPLPDTFGQTADRRR